MSGYPAEQYEVDRDLPDESTVLRLRLKAGARLRLLARRVLNLLGNDCRLERPLSGLRILEIEAVLEVDDFALVLAHEFTDDLHFVVEVDGAPKVLFFSNDIDAVAKVVAGYLIRRHEGDEELARHVG